MFLIGLITGAILLTVCDNIKKIGKIFLTIMAFLGYFGWEIAYSRIDDVSEVKIQLCMCILAGFPIIAIYYYAEYLSLKEYCKKKKYDLSGYEWLKKNGN